MFTSHGNRKGCAIYNDGTPQKREQSCSPAIRHVGVQLVHTTTRIDPMERTACAPGRSGPPLAVEVPQARRVLGLERVVPRGIDGRERACLLVTVDVEHPVRYPVVPPAPARHLPHLGEALEHVGGSPGILRDTEDPLVMVPYADPPGWPLRVPTLDGLQGQLELSGGPLGVLIRREAAQCVLIRHVPDEHGIVIASELGCGVLAERKVRRVRGVPVKITHDQCSHGSPPQFGHQLCALDEEVLALDAVLLDDALVARVDREDDS